MQIGNIATAYFTVAIAIHTFNSLVLRKRQSICVYGPTIIIGWLTSFAVGEYLRYTSEIWFSKYLSWFLAFVPLLPQMGPLYGPSALACGVRLSFPWHLFFFHLLPVSRISHSRHEHSTKYGNYERFS